MTDGSVLRGRELVHCVDHDAGTAARSSPAASSRRTFTSAQDEALSGWEAAQATGGSSPGARPKMPGTDTSVTRR